MGRGEEAEDGLGGNEVLGMVKSRRIYTALAVWHLGCEEGWRGKGTEIFSNSSGHGITLYKYNYLKSC